jgi:hypothetical protein
LGNRTAIVRNRDDPGFVSATIPQARERHAVANRGNGAAPRISQRCCVARQTVAHLKAINAIATYDDLCELIQA